MVATVLLLIAPHAALPTAAELNKAAIQDDTLRGLNEGAARFVRPVAQQFPKERVSRAHIEWCYKKHRTYRLSDNTYLGKDGKRRKCVSPFG
jgi:hypothetical protein